MSQIKGVIEAVSCKEGKTHPKYGKSFITSIKIGEDWYGAFTKKTAEALGLERGRLVTFTAIQNGEYTNFDPKSLSISEDAPAPVQTGGGKPAGSKGGYSGSNNAGIKVGHAINNAVQLAIAGKDTSLKNIHGLAVDIIALSVKLEGQFDSIVAGATERLAGKGSTTPSKAAEAPAAAPKPKATAKAKAKAAPAKAAEEDENADQHEDAPGAPEPDQSWDDDDIPF